MEISADSLETNFDCMSRLMIFDEPVLRGCDVAKLEPWY
jgi:hypothetical protein